MGLPLSLVPPPDEEFSMMAATPEGAFEVAAVHRFGVVCRVREYRGLVSVMASVSVKTAKK